MKQLSLDSNICFTSHLSLKNNDGVMLLKTVSKRIRFFFCDCYLCVMGKMILHIHKELTNDLGRYVNCGNITDI